MTDSTTFIGVAAPSTPWIAAASPACSAPTAEPIAWPRASSKLKPPEDGVGACPAPALRLWPKALRADRPWIIVHLLAAGAPHASFIRATVVLSMSADCLA